MASVEASVEASVDASFEIDEVKAVLGWHHDGVPQYLAEPDPKSSFIHFTLHFDTTLALLEISIPISYKQHTRTSAICIRINPRSITSLTQSIVRDLPDAAKPIFGFTPATCLDFELNDAVTVLIPSFITEPVTAARKRSGIIINSLYELTQATSAYLHPRRYTVSRSARVSQYRDCTAEAASILRPRL
jgi:hypothetical protein